MKWRSRVTPVVQLDRVEKARMIERVLEDFLGSTLEGFRILDVGCGNGDISNHLGKRNVQYGVDVSDRRRVQNRQFEFRLVESEILPFDSSCFDIVVSHHVIEHVNDHSRHLTEIHRVLRPDGCAYLATPNRSSPLMKGHVGNNQVLRYRQMEPLFARCGFEAHRYTDRMLNEAARFGLAFRFGRLVPAPIIAALSTWIPSHTFMLRPLALEQ